jgi:UrcA family protein
MMMKTALAALAALAIATSASATPTQNPMAKDQAILNLQGIDLASAEGQQRLAIRMDQAARAVCGENLANVHLAAEAKAQACRTAVIADVRSQIESRMALASAPTRVALAN